MRHHSPDGDDHIIVPGHLVFKQVQLARGDVGSQFISGLVIAVAKRTKQGCEDGVTVLWAGGRLGVQCDCGLFQLR